MRAGITTISFLIMFFVASGLSYGEIQLAQGQLEDYNPDKRPDRRPKKKSILSPYNPTKKPKPLDVIPPRANSVKIGTLNITRSTNSFQVGIGGHTNQNGYSRLLVVSTPGSHGGVIINTVLVKVNNQYRKTQLGARTNRGENYYNIDIPRGATEIRMSLGSGADSVAEFYLAR